MTFPASVNLQIVTTIGAVCMALLVIFLRLRASAKPVTTKKILIPPLGMTTGYLMFVVPQTHIPLLYALAAICAGIVLSYPLIRTSKFEARDGHIYMRRSKSFALILLALLAVRLALHSYVEQFISLPQTGAVFFILAYGMIVPWRIWMFQKYRLLQKYSRA
ncbi:CcdC family protein [Effusibacillus dendaii]|uniref:Membrane protein n=1 Tax=Effusibacillus dendaii TaxID=2743772 RepID=A0A7I8DCK5_9BACL|nr:cytochrome c biogenesis protein CcdC [Effusibacillus dendaii]BCJ87815.1 membrane protein [Effusibacillus dendaii]